MKIFIVDDHRILAEGIEGMLKAHFSVVGIFTDPQTALKELKKNKCDLLLVDYGLPGLNGIEFYKKAIEIQPNIKAVMLSMYDESALARESLQAGFNGYLLKNIDQNELIVALKKVMSGHTYVSAEITSALLKPENSITFTRREMDVLKLIAKEYSNKQIAQELGLSERTVETYRKNLFQKTGVTNVVGLINYAYQNRIIRTSTDV